MHFKIVQVVLEKIGLGGSDARLTVVKIVTFRSNQTDSVWIRILPLSFLSSRALSLPFLSSRIR